MAGCAVSAAAPTQPRGGVHVRAAGCRRVAWNTPCCRRCQPPQLPSPHITAAGHNSHGQLGVGNTGDLAEPQSLKVARRWAAISLGGSHAAGVTGQGEVYTWGLNDKGQLGMPTGPGESKDVPRRMELLVGWNVK